MATKIANQTNLYYHQAKKKSVQDKRRYVKMQTETAYGFIGILLLISEYDFPNTELHWKQRNHLLTSSISKFISYQKYYIYWKY